MTLIATSTALTLALSLCPTSRAVTSSAMTTAAD
jgi:hypothetical protein